MDVKDPVPFDAARRDLSTYAILFVLYAAVLYPILRANRLYDDDLGRVLVGRTGWDATGRPLTTLLMRALQCYNHAMVDISPLTQIAAIAVLAWIGVLAARRFDIRSPWAAALATFPLGGQPFFLMNLSYKFDALSMGLAVFFAALAALNQSTGRRGWWLGILWMFCSLNFYQAAINVYLLYVLLEWVVAMLHHASPAELRRRFVWRASQALVGMLIYELLIGITMINGWVGRNAHMVRRPEQLLLLPRNIANFYRYIGDGFNEQWWRYYLPVLLLLMVLPSVIAIHYVWKRRRTQPPLATAGLLLASLLLPVMGLLGMMGPMLLLVKPLLSERVMIGAGGWLSMGLIMAYLAFKQWRRSPRWMLGMAWMLAVGMEVMASAYGNAQADQVSYESRIAQRLADDYATLRARTHVKALLLGGSAGYGPIAEHIIKQMPIMARIVSPYLSGADTFHTPQLLAYFMPHDSYISYSAMENPSRFAVVRAVLASTCTMPPWRQTQAYDLYKVGDIAVAVFRKQPEFKCDDVADGRASYSGARVPLLGEPLKTKND